MREIKCVSKKCVKKNGKNYICPECSGLLMVGGNGYKRVPVGVGLRGRKDKFVVDFFEYRGTFCQCLRCGREFLLWGRKGIVSKYFPLNLPKGV